jgi:hypothetical protein
LISDVLARAYLVSSADNSKGLSAKANPQGLSFGSFTSHNTAEVLRQMLISRVNFRPNLKILKALKCAYLAH